MTKAIGLFAGICLLIGGVGGASAGDGSDALTPLSVGSTSELKNKKHAYAAAKALDGSNTTAWCEGAKSDGSGEALLISGTDLSFSRLEINVGFWKSAKLFKDNNQPLAIAVSVTDLEGNAQGFDVAVEAGMNTTVLDVGSVIDASEIRIEFVAVTKGKMNDSCISEVRMLRGDMLRIPWFESAAAIQDLQVTLWGINDTLASCDAGALGNLFKLPATIGGKKVKKLKDLVKVCAGGTLVGIEADLDFSMMTVSSGGSVVYRSQSGDYHLTYEYNDDGTAGVWKVSKVE